ncbi:MAG TPA: ArsA-related P-loop ATPase [Thermoleophilaceae bacterium]|nr:ArsA-related P-loop ATPase [Thermoleophilaceae bacterium]
MARLLDRREIVICAGAGGVGKTTTAAAIALGMAERGLKVAVLTIDPARRLAGSLGLPELGNEEHRVEIEGSGELWALMLDAKRTFDDLIEKHAPDERARDAVLSNRIYQELSNAVAGSQEYMAMEKLYELHQEERYDLLVLDTPPTRNALDFLDAPERLSRFVDSRSLQLFLRPGRLGLKVFGRGTGMLFSVLKGVTGVDLLQDLSEFFASFGDMAEGFRERAARVNELLGDPRTTFLLVTSPRRDAIDEGIFFHRRLRERSLPFGGAIVNRMSTLALLDEPVDEDELEALLGRALGRRVAGNLEDYQAIAARDRQNVERLAARLGGPAPILVPHLDDDVHDLAGLREMNQYLFASEAVPAR